MSANPAGGSGKSEGRDSWCTPKWLADLLGKFDLDPCSNPRSHIRASRRLMLEEGSDGLYPYAHGEVLKWVKHWRHTRFCFLLRWDPSTKWFAELIPHCTHVWFPARRINFEPPPGVKSSSNPFPHALYLRDPDQEMLDALAANGFLFPVDQDIISLYLDADDGHAERTGDTGDAGEEAPRGPSGSGGDAGGGPAKVLEGIPDDKPKERPKKEGCGVRVGKYGIDCAFQAKRDGSGEGAEVPGS